MIQKTYIKKIYGSFRDNCSHVELWNGQIHRRILQPGVEAYCKFVDSGLYEKLTSEGLLIRHSEVERKQDANGNISEIIIKPEQIDCITYPYEWSFNQYKDAASLTLEIQRIALTFGMSLKDASAYNVMYAGGLPIFIDTGSFEISEKSQLWVAYKQFCEHFLAPLYLMAMLDVRMSNLMKLNINGIPLDLACKLLQYKILLNFGSLIHIYLHSKFINISSNKPKKEVGKEKIPKKNTLILIDSLARTVHKIKPCNVQTEWGNYYSDLNYSHESHKNKLDFVVSIANKIRPKKIVDLGANDGSITLSLMDCANHIVAIDMDHNSIDSLNKKLKLSEEKKITTIISDLSNPSPNIGWGLLERDGLVQRIKCDCMIALAIIHHLVITNGLTFDKLAEFFCTVCDDLIVEFVEKEDSQIKRIIDLRTNAIEWYSRTNFEDSMAKYFNLTETKNIEGTLRFIYHYKRKFHA